MRKAFLPSWYIFPVCFFEVRPCLKASVSRILWGPKIKILPAVCSVLVSFMTEAVRVLTERYIHTEGEPVYSCNPDIIDLIRYGNPFYVNMVMRCSSLCSVKPGFSQSNGVVVAPRDLLLRSEFLRVTRACCSELFLFHTLWMWHQWRSRCRQISKACWLERSERLGTCIYRPSETMWNYSTGFLNVHKKTNFLTFIQLFETLVERLNTCGGKIYAGLSVL